MPCWGRTQTTAPARPLPIAGRGAFLAHGASSLGALTSGYQLALGVGALISLLGAFLAVVLLRQTSVPAGNTKRSGAGDADCAPRPPSRAPCSPELGAAATVCSGTPS